ncbi:Tetratricopeptide repeat protein [Enhygromyxa salina]|uniref:Tetratricopeptide repeat protein n=1 Tax=Enhygromyxa salina TaxID=215803 RepID=A0A2S9XEU0_9BACT|nr:hypothetical protein [Enhygromyxa salina]PRP91388.1 Tetratricopeptide repeat protein [Enhygromyxa salina]
MANAKLDGPTFEAEIGDYDEEYRCEFKVGQITPVWGTACEAFLLVRPEAEDAVAAIFEGFSDRLLGFFRAMTSEAVDKTWKGDRGAVLEPVPPGRIFVRLAHDADRNYAGYENIYRRIVELAPHVEDCRFVISEDYNTWVDAYRIVDGELVFERGWAENEFVDGLSDYYEREAQARPADRAWVRFAARELADWAAYHLGRAEHPSRSKGERRKSRKLGRGYVERALALDEREAMCCAQMARLLRLERRPAEAREWFERHAALTADPETLLAGAFASIEAGDDAGAPAWLEQVLDADPEHQAAHQLLALLADRAGEHERAREHARAAFELCVSARAAGRGLAVHAELLHRSGLYRELLAVYLDALDGLVETEARREALARELLVWAELFRIKMCHGIEVAESTELAVRFYERVHALHPLGGDVYTAHALFLRQAKREGSDALLESLLDSQPDHLEALSELGASAFRREDWPRAIELLERAVERARETGAGGYRRNFDSSQLIRAMLNQGNRLLERGGEANYADADAWFVRALATVARLGGERAAWYALVLRRCAAHTLRGLHREAFAFAEEAVELAPGSVHAMSELASCYCNLGHYGDALAAVELAAELASDYWHVPYVRACVLARTGAPLADVITSLARALELEPGRRELIAGDPDFETIRERAEFRALVDGAAVDDE